MREYTRTMKDFKTLIDYIITNNEMVSTSISTNNKISDHECIDTSIENGNEQKIRETEIDISNYNKNRFNNELSAILEMNEIDNINEYVYNFDNCFEQTIEKFIVKTKMHENNNKWFSNDGTEWNACKQGKVF